MTPWNKIAGPRYPQDKMDLALRFAKEGWSARLSLSKAGIKGVSRIEDELRFHPTYLEIKRIAKERALARRPFIVF